jgi:hypothetical protein
MLSPCFAGIGHRFVIFAGDAKQQGETKYAHYRDGVNCDFCTRLRLGDKRAALTCRRRRNWGRFGFFDFARLIFTALCFASDFGRLFFRLGCFSLT